MAKQCCETNNTKPPFLWGIWLKKAVYAIVIAIVIFIIWNQYMYGQ